MCSVFYFPVLSFLPLITWPLLDWLACFSCLTLPEYISIVCISENAVTNIQTNMPMSSAMEVFCIVACTHMHAFLHVQSTHINAWCRRKPHRCCMWLVCTLILTIPSEAFPPLALFVPNWNALVNITISPVRPLILWCFDLDPLSRLHKNRSWFSSKGAGKTSGIGGRLRTGRETNSTHSNPACKQHTNSNRGVESKHYCTS